MNKTNVLLNFGAALLLAPLTSTLAQSTWQTVADFQSVPFTAVDALTKDAAGNLYTTVSSTDDERRMHAQVRKSSDQGTTWTVVEDFVSAVGGSTKFLSLGADTAGHLYAAGYTEDGKGETRWIVRKGSNGGNSWSAVDDFAGPGGQTVTAQAFAADASGNLYVAGFGDESPSDGEPGRRMHWLVRQSRDGGRNWSTIDDFSYSFSARAAAIVSTDGNLFVAGSGWTGKESGERWLVRKGTVDGAGGFRWQTVDEFQLQENNHGYDSRPHGLTADARGNLYAVGRSNARAQGTGGAHWIVRRSSGTGSDWTVVDKFQLDPGSFAAACGVAATGQGGVYVVGRAASRNSGSHWIVRHSPTGEAGTWPVSDNFKFKAAAASALAGAGVILKTADGSMTSSPPEICSGVAIVGDAKHVFAGGSAFAGTGHAIVRKLEIGRETAVTAARAP